MKISKIKVENYRLLKDFSIDLEDDLSLVIGKNNTGKTSMLLILDKFLNNQSDKSKFSYDDFNIDFKKYLKSVTESTEEIDEDDFKKFNELGIKLKLFISYNKEDSLENINRVMMDLDPENNTIVLRFGYTLNYFDYLRLRNDLVQFKSAEEEKKTKDEKYEVKDFAYFLKNNLTSYFKITRRTVEFDKSSSTENDDNYIDLVQEKINVSNIINFKFISAKREVTNTDSDKTLSSQTSKIYTKTEVSDDQRDVIDEFKEKLSDADTSLSNVYKALFSGAIEKVKNFGGVKINESEIEIISTLQHQKLLDGNTTVVYRHDTENQLPEYYNGLGYMNLISMIFEIEILLQDFKKQKDTKPSDINLLFIEEPEAHTHPQMQYVFIKNIKKLLGEGIKRTDGENRKLQYIISTHSSHIVADSDFDDIKYLKKENKIGVIAKNLKDLKREYVTDTEQYDFLKQYLTISRAEVFFAEKAILIEGDTERILIPTIMKKVDIEESQKYTPENPDSHLPLLSQNISIIEVGAYSQIFEKFINFLGIKALVLTDIDSIKITGKNDDGSDKWGACPVFEGTATSNSAIRYFLDKPFDQLKKLDVKNRVVKKESSEILICYQQEQGSYHARSFEDAFIHVNKKFIGDNKDKFMGLKNKKLFIDESKNAYELAENCINKKTHFALDILFHSNEKLDNWVTPTYIYEGLLWLKQD
jgi:predicted ATP-dependent endonuclease of OLD family